MKRQMSMKRRLEGSIGFKITCPFIVLRVPAVSIAAAAEEFVGLAAGIVAVEREEIFQLVYKSKLLF